MNNDKEQDALFEALISTKEFREAQRPMTYYSGKLETDWWGGISSEDRDIIYYNKLDTRNIPILHRIYGPAYISKKFDIEGWYKEGMLHREDGPAYRHKNNRYWFHKGNLHRLDGPAVDAKGHPKEYWINGSRLPPKEYKKEIERRKRKGQIK